MKTDIYFQECREIKTSVQGVSIHDFSLITGPYIFRYISIYLKRTYYGLSRYIDYVVLSSVVYKCSSYDVFWLRC